MTEGDRIGMTCLLHGLIDIVIKAASERGIPPQEAFRVLSAEILMIAAELHDGNDASFLAMARRSLALARTGAVEQ
jgi:hypothetical protein